jgi:hypothetical protein
MRLKKSDLKICKLLEYMKLQEESGMMQMLNEPREDYWDEL